MTEIHEDIAQETLFLQTVANALGRDKVLAEAPARREAGPPAFWREQQFEKEQPLELFKTNLEALTGKVAVVHDRNEATNQIRLWLKLLNAKTAIVWDHPQLLDYIEFSRLEVKTTYWNTEKARRELIASAEQADVGITWAHYAIGYTGTLALFNGAHSGRSVSLLPPSHIAVMKKSDIVPTMSVVMRNLIERRGQGDLPSTVDFITGPSRTSDIEMDLSIGVHGPFRVWAVVIDEQ
ncbi:LutC/YkgG family protein [Sporomusa acidovorans]|uniref:Lactate utilization protein C n=1 Tax=Sporomusa acidovorans (strain ATCC 49682 / DSM 3132 / Mol) TaxID=1123286 RepID=A0ABZ3J8C4_SPOA4|nr:lactate utilization protein C [Sporomusa acidovorans]OZC16687.1 lactate utilization protein C [Sporomusa acidovorans DSM 3132]SDE06127.1 L-lactate dehydrogenase complex protein LldG [Sporomusa acidovorans]